MHAPVFLALGSNVGAREETLALALRALSARGFRSLQASSLYLTEPVGGPPQDWYVNQVAGGETDLGPQPLLAACLDIERAFGRVRSLKDAPRTLDVDILFYADVILDSPELELPHPRLHERRFVLVPLVEIAPDLVHPVFKQTARELLARCPDRSSVLLHAPAGKHA